MALRLGAPRDALIHAGASEEKVQRPADIVLRPGASLLRAGHRECEPLRSSPMSMPFAATFILAVTSCLICAGCTPDLFGIAMGVKPGQTIDLVTASPSQVVLQYTRSYSWELAAAGRYADGQCGRFGRHAALVSTVSESVDRSVATFRCE